MIPREGPEGLEVLGRHEITRVFSELLGTHYRVEVSADSYCSSLTVRVYDEEFRIYCACTLPDIPTPIAWIKEMVDAMLVQMQNYLEEQHAF